MKSEKRIDVLIEGAMIVTMDQDRQVIDKGVIAISGDRIVQVTPAEQLAESHAAGKVIKADGMVAVPGFINAHSHLAMTLFRGFVEDLELHRWLERVWKYELSALNEKSVRVGSALAIAELIRSGVTCAHDMYWHYETTMALAEEIGFRLVSGPPLHDIGGQDMDKMVSQARKVLDRMREYRYVTPIVQAHSVYTTSPDMMKSVLALKEEYGVVFTTHASENKSEVEDVEAKFGVTPVECLQSYGLLDDRAILAHCVQLKDEDIEILKDCGCHVVHCPESNLKLGAGIARIAEMLEAGINVCIGTDGAASNNDLDMLGEMKTAALLQKGFRNDPTVLTTLDVMEMATIAGAQAYGLDHDIGSIETGKKADIVLIDFRKPHLTPCHDVYANLVYAASKADVAMVMIDGRIQLDEGRLCEIEEQSLMAEAASIGRGFV